MPKKNTRKRALHPKNLTHGNLPASVQLVMEGRDELRADIGSVRHELSAVRHELKAEIGSLRHELKAEIGAVRSELKVEIGFVRAEVGSVRSEVQQVLVSVHRTQAIMEEQRGENRIVLDGLKNVTERQDRIEAEIIERREH